MGLLFNFVFFSDIAIGFSSCFSNIQCNALNFSQRMAVIQEENHSTVSPHYFSLKVHKLLCKNVEDFVQSLQFLSNDINSHIHWYFIFLNFSPYGLFFLQVVKQLHYPNFAIFKIYIWIVYILKCPYSYIISFWHKVSWLYFSYIKFFTLLYFFNFIDE